MMRSLLGGSAAQPGCQYANTIRVYISCSVEWCWHKLVCAHCLRGGGGGVQGILGFALLDPTCGLMLADAALCEWAYCLRDPLSVVIQRNVSGRSCGGWVVALWLLGLGDCWWLPVAASAEWLFVVAWCCLG